jgi:predicted RNA-binding Zn ribbon-like protein
VASDPFRFDSGSLALDLVATLGWRSGARADRLSRPEDFAAWLGHAGLASPVPEVGEAGHAAALALREAIDRAARLAARGEVPDRADRLMINRLAGLPLRVPGLDADGRLSWSATDPVTAALGTIARDAAVLVAGPDRASIRACHEPRCAMLFVDRSRGRRRRWCSMAECGNRAKVAAHRERAARSAASLPPVEGPDHAG